MMDKGELRFSDLSVTERLKETKLVMDDLEVFREDKPVGSPGSHQPIIETSGISIAILLRKWLISLLVGA